ncbi:MAG: chemotaxis protein CheD [Oscillospiraceae bacterium]
MVSEQKNVGIADMKICKAPDTIITYALGSCVGIVLYDQQIKTSALIHIMLPDAMSNPPDNVYKYANTAIEETLKKLDIRGNDTGGITARTMVFDPDTGVVTLRIAGKGQKTL